MAQKGMNLGKPALAINENTAGRLAPLPMPPAYFSGRGKELKAVMEDFQKGVALIGLNGPAGIGKTALGLVIAQGIKKYFPDGQVLVDLQGAARQTPMAPAEAMRQVLWSLVREARLPEDDNELARLYYSALAERNILIFLDNASGASQVRPLLPPPGSFALVTSEESLASLTLADHKLEPLAPREASRFLSKIAPGVTESQAESIAKQCEGLPLALRLAAGILKNRPDWTSRNLVGTLDEALKRLGPLEACLGLDYVLLPDEAKLRFRKTAVFAASFSTHQAAKVWEVDEEQAASNLAALRGACLVEVDDMKSWYYLHDRIRDFAQSRLNGMERNAASRNHAKLFMVFLSVTNTLYLSGGEIRKLELAFFDSQALDIKSAQRWAAENDPDLCCAFPSAGADVLRARLTTREKIDWLESAAAAAAELGKKEYEAVHLGNLGSAYITIGEAHKAVECQEKALAIEREINNRSGEGTVLNNLGLAYASLGETRLAIDFYGKALAVAREVGEKHSQANALGNLGNAHTDLGETQTAIGYYEEALTCFREAGNRLGEANILSCLGYAFYSSGWNRKAVELYEKALDIYHETGELEGELHVKGNLLAARKKLNETDKIINDYENQVDISGGYDDPQGEGVALGNLANRLYRHGDKDEAVEQMREALKIFEQTGSHHAQWARDKLHEWEEEAKIQ